MSFTSSTVWLCFGWRGWRLRDLMHTSTEKVYFREAYCCWWCAQKFKLSHFESTRGLNRSSKCECTRNLIVIAEFLKRVSRVYAFLERTKGLGAQSWVDCKISRGADWRHFFVEFYRCVSETVKSSMMCSVYCVGMIGAHASADRTEGQITQSAGVRGGRLDRDGREPPEQTPMYALLLSLIF